MAPVNQKLYRFSPESIVQLRERLGLSQAELARSLGVPPNTVSRWEIGTTTPDAASLAAIHSIAMERGITPSFFRKKRKKQTVKRTRLLVVWDFENLAAQIQHVPDIDAWLRAECEKRFPKTTHRIFKAFVRATPGYSLYDPSDTLENHDWKVWEESENLDETVIDHCKSDCGHEPSRTILVLVARDGDYADMINELKDRKVQVYLLGFGFSQELVNAVGKRRLIELPRPDNDLFASLGIRDHPWISNAVIHRQQR